MYEEDRSSEWSSMPGILNFISVDLETTGLSAARERIIEIGAVKYREGKPVETFSEFVRQEIPIPERIVALTGITQDDIKDAPFETEQMTKFLEFASEDTVFLGHNLGFDFSFLAMAAARMGLTIEKQGLDTLKISKKCCYDMDERTLSALCDHFGVVNEAAHRAYCDAKATAEVYLCLLEQYGSEYPEVFRAEPLVYKPKKVEPATEKQIKYLKALLDYHGIEADINYGTLTKSEASRRIDAIILNYGLMNRN